MGKGYMGKVLWVDLSLGTFEYETIPDSVYEQVLSGVGLSAKLLYERIPANADPMGPKNILGIVSGLLTGSGAHFSGRWMVVGKSPLTGGWGDANCGGTLAPAIKRCGVDAIFFKGKSKKPVYLQWIKDEPELLDASHLWGTDAVEAEIALQKEAEEAGVKRAKVALIGQAGENLSLISGVVNDGGRIAARSGLGAVMGSKNLKAVVLAGKKKIEIHDKPKVKELNKKFMKWLNMGMGAQKVFSQKIVDSVAALMGRSPVAMALTGDMLKVTFKRYGTICTNTLSSENGDSPVKNWKGSRVDFPLGSHASKLNPALIVKDEVKKYNCFSCPLGCGGIMKFKPGRFDFEEMHKVEYETCCSLGALVLNKDLDTIYRLNNLLNRAGMDTISAGAVVSFAMECYEKGIISQDDLDGIDLKWGDAEAIEAFMEKMISREGCGDLFADGVKVAAKKIGNGAENLGMHAGGQEMAMHDTRFDPGFAVTYACDPTPGRHTTISYQWLEMFAMHKVFKGLPKMPAVYTVKDKYKPSKARDTLLVAGSQYTQTGNGCGLCLFGLEMGGNLKVPDYINATTGWNNPPQFYLEVGKRIQAIRQAFNVKHGLKTLEDFKLPRRVVGKPALKEGPLKNVTLDEERLINSFLSGMGWDTETAVPLRETLEGLGLDNIAQEIHG